MAKMRKDRFENICQSKAEPSDLAGLTAIASLGWATGGWKMEGVLREARRKILVTTAVTLCLCISVVAQTAPSDKDLLTKTRGLYDAPFAGNLVSFDCAVQFDWEKHISDLLGTVPPGGMT